MILILTDIHIIFDVYLSSWGVSKYFLSLNTYGKYFNIYNLSFFQSISVTSLNQPHRPSTNSVRDSKHRPPTDQVHPLQLIHHREIVSTLRRVHTSGDSLNLRGPNGNIRSAPVEDGVGAIDTIGVADGVAGGPGGDGGEAQVRIDAGWVAIDGHNDVEGVVRGSPERQGDRFGSGIVGGRGGGGEAGEEGSGGSGELHLDAWS